MDNEQSSLTHTSLPRGVSLVKLENLDFKLRGKFSSSRCSIGTTYYQYSLSVVFDNDLELNPINKYLCVLKNVQEYDINEPWIVSNPYVFDENAIIHDELLEYRVHFKRLPIEEVDLYIVLLEII